MWRSITDIALLFLKDNVVFESWRQVQWINISAGVGGQMLDGLKVFSSHK